MSGYLATAHLWLPAYLRRPRIAMPAGVKDVMIALCDHFEPLHQTDKAGARERLQRWITEFPRNIAPFRDADGIRPRHTFFYPVEQYDADLLKQIEELLAVSGGEVEVHLHHDRENGAQFTRHIREGVENFQRHGFLGHDARGRTRFGFVHGDWALDNSHPAGAQCGVNDELRLLRELGCYADFTLPSAPDPTQTRTINRLYYAADSPAPKSHDRGVTARVMHATPTPWTGPEPRFGDLLIVQGPLGLNWRRRKWGVLPRVENADLTDVNPPTAERMRLWTDLHVHVTGRPEWVFIKLHCHGGTPRNSAMFLGDAYRRFHEQLAAAYVEARGWRLHYVTAREMVNIIHAAEDGHAGNAGAFRDYRYRPPGRGGSA